MVEDEGFVERWLKGLVALRRLVLNPEDTQQVFKAGVRLNKSAFPGVLRSLEACESGRRILAERPAIDSRSVDFDALLALPAGTLGHEYAAFLRRANLTPDLFTAPTDVRNPLAAYVMQRVRQTHDIWHVLTGYGPDVAGEIELQAFTFGQLRAPLAFLIAVFGSLRFERANPGLRRRALAAWRRGRDARPFLPVEWERRWATPVADLRTELAA